MSLVFWVLEIGTSLQNFVAIQLFYPKEQKTTSWTYYSKVSKMHILWGIKTVHAHPLNNLGQSGGRTKVSILCLHYTHDMAVNVQKSQRELKHRWLVPTFNVNFHPVVSLLSLNDRNHNPIILTEGKTELILYHISLKRKRSNTTVWLFLSEIFCRMIFRSWDVL